ncbi:MAG: NAD(P)-binding domain-containing protein [Bacilli bacterium]|nr:NAD(P)-binding domain-containing protein [Bacilli bacterium]
MSRVAVIGSGSFGCVLANLIKENGHEVKIWSFSEEEKEAINEYHYCRYIQGHINEDVKCTTSIEEAIKDTDLILIVTPSFAVRNTCKEIAQTIGNQQVIIASKGLEGDKVLSEVAKEELNREIGVISGPSHAEQIYVEKPTYFDYYGPEEYKRVFQNNYITLEDCNDPLGMQLGAALKNIIAIGYGKAHGLNQDTNTTSAYLSKAFREMISIGTALGAKPETFLGFSGLGDLLTTVGSLDSRNLKCGILLGKGKKLEEIKNEVGMTIEGLNALDSAYKVIEEHNLDCPEITSLYYQIHQDDVYKNDKSLNKIF